MLVLVRVQVAYAWAISLGGDEGAVLLRKLGLLEQVSQRTGCLVACQGKWKRNCSLGGYAATVIEPHCSLTCPRKRIGKWPYSDNATCNKMRCLLQAIDYATESGAFAQAFELTRAGAKQKLPEVHLK